MSRTYKDLREWISLVDDLGELKRIKGADWNLEMGAITELLGRESPYPPPAVLFESIPGYPVGFRTIFGATGSVQRAALTLGFDNIRNGTELVAAYRGKTKDLKSISPKVVETGPIFENIDSGDDVDLYKFPVPMMHEIDGGRYIGTNCLVITKHPDEGWVNLGTYRVMVHGKDHTAFFISPGKHGRIHRDLYLERKQPCPVAVCVGHDPLLFLAAGNEIPYGLSEYEYAGAIKGEPIEVVLGKYTGLPIPARAEIAFEGEAVWDDRKKEGPFGEWTGYYGSGAREEPVIRVKNVYYRNNPILTCSRPSRPPSDYSFSKGIVKSALIWEELEKCGVPNVKGVWCHESGGGRLFNVVSIKQTYPGHARQAALIASQSHAGGYLNRFVVVVDEDIDPSNLFDVVWAMSTRCDVAEDIDILRKCWSGPLDPVIPKGMKGFNSRAIIDACRPYNWKDAFPPVAENSKELRDKTFAKWKDVLGLG
ncbi:MAG TPA: UbiD family decarboxylase [Syntrophorhabdales bacterium]|nr:UbiD family decarboxylase [Syntrophorhabdales bacterium]